MSEVLVVGSLAYDSVKTPSGKADKSLGGSANYFSVAASLFAKVRVVGVVGDDYLESDKKILRDRNVDLSGMQTVHGQTFHWEGSYEQNLNEAVTLKTELNVFASFNPQIPEIYKTSKFVFLANIDPALQLQVLAQISKPLFIGMDTMNYWISSKKDELLKVLNKIDIVFMNETEAKMLTELTNPISAIKKIAEMGPQYVVIKRGEYGSTLFSKADGFFQLPALPVENVVDPTGAGDSFAGGFFGHLASKCESRPTWSDLKKAVLAGTVFSSQTIQDFSLKALVKVDASNYEKHLVSLQKTVSI